MKGIFTALLLTGIITLCAISIYDIQYTTNPGSNNTYPSVYAGKTVSVEGVVTAINHRNGGFFISELSGGPWRGIFIRSEATNVKSGDRLIIRGTVDEYFGMTCLRDLTQLKLLNSGYPLPFANQVTTGQITTPDQAEAYESTLVRVQNASFIQSQGNNQRLVVNDGSGSCLLNSFFSNDKIRVYKAGELFTSITGIVCYAYGDYSINPRYSNDVAVMVPVFNQNRSWGRIKSIYR